MTRKLLALAKTIWLDLFLAVSLTGLTILSSIGLMGTSAYLITSAGFQPSIGALQVAIVGVRFFGISRAVFRYLERLVSHSVNLRLLSKLRVWVFEQLVEKYPFKFSRRRNAELLSFMTHDIDTLENFYVRFLSPILSALIVSVVVVIFLGFFSWEIMLSTAAGLLLAGLIVPWLAIQFSRLMKGSEVSARSGYGEEIGDFLTGYQEMQLYRSDQEILKTLEKRQQAVDRIQRQSGFFQALVSALSLLSSQGTMLIVIILAGFLLANERIDAVMLSVFTLVCISAFEAVVNLPAVSVQFEEMQVAAKRIFSIEDLESAVMKDEGRWQPNRIFPIQLRNVSYSYRDVSDETLKNISFRVDNKDKIAIVGASGAGKSTILELIGGLRNDFEGEIQYGDVLHHEIATGWLRGQISSVSSTPYLFATSMRQNLLLANPAASEAELINVIELVGLSLPNKDPSRLLDYPIIFLGENLSAGEQQRTAIAQALLRDNKLLLFDEPLANLDPIIAERLMLTIFKLFKDAGIIWVTHSLLHMELFDEILVMDQGIIVERGSHTALIEKKGAYFRLFSAKTQ